MGGWGWDVCVGGGGGEARARAKSNMKQHPAPYRSTARSAASGVTTALGAQGDV